MDRELVPNASPPLSASLSPSRPSVVESFDLLASRMREAKDLAPNGFRVT